MGKKFDQNELKNETRMNQEGTENMGEVKVNAPSNRQQTEQQVNNVDTTKSTVTPDNQFGKRKVKAQGGVLKQEVMSKLLSTGGAPGSDVSSPATYGLRTLTYSGNSGTISGGAADTPVMKGDFQGRTRVDKRLSDPNKDINFLASEQVEVEYDNIPPLANSSSTVGYNGNPKNVNARTQKIAGATPAELLYDRSLDYIVDDVGLFVSGQVVKQNGVEYGDYPTKTQLFNPETNMVETKPFTSVRGNFAPRAIVAKFKKDDKGMGCFLSSFEVLEDDLSASNENYDTVNRAGTNEKIFINQSELTRQRIDAKCGSPSQEHFNPLGRSVLEETATCGYLRDMENACGATIFTAYKMANKARSFYLTRTSKDGQALIDPAIDALYGHLMNQTSAKAQSEQYKASRTPEDNKTSIFKNTPGITAGSAAIMLGLFDSWGKYKTKADIINQPRGLKLHYQTADNNINPFRVDRNFVAALNSVDVFSTIDRGYDPMNATCATDGVRLIYPYSFRDKLKFTRASYGAARVYDDQLFGYKYSAGNGGNSYLVKCADPLLNGIAYFMEIHANEIFEALGGGTKELTWNIPTVHYGKHIGLWDFLIMASTPYIVYERTNTMKDILDFEGNFEYPFDGMVSIKDANPMNAVNYRSVSPFEPLITGTMLPSSALRWICPEMVQRMGDKGYMLPYYFSEDEYTATGSSANDLAITKSGNHAFTTVVLRSGLRQAFLDDLMSMEAKDLQLCLDRMVRLPFISKANAYAEPNTTSGGVIYKYSQDAEGIPVITDVSKSNATALDYLSTPRQLGWFFTGINGWARRKDFALPANSGNVTFAGLSDLTTISVAKREILPSTFAIEYKGVKADELAAPTTLSPSSIAVSRAQSFTQSWFVKAANGGADDKFDIALSVGEVYTNKNGVAAGAKYTPFVFMSAPAGVDNIYTGISLFSIHNELWGLLQKTPFVLSPFGAIYDSVDPFMIAYVFGLAGFMAADYAEEDFNRTSLVLNQGYGYTVDPFVKDSPVFKDAYAYTQV